jgi:hypothetical protein
MPVTAPVQAFKFIEGFFPINPFPDLTLNCYWTSDYP